MNPYEARKLARRLHEDRARRIETILVRLAAEGTLSEDKYRAERDLADDLANVLHRFLTEDDDVIMPEVERVLARHKAAF